MTIFVCSLAKDLARKQSDHKLPVSISFRLSVYKHASERLEEKDLVCSCNAHKRSHLWTLDQISLPVKGVKKPWTSLALPQKGVENSTAFLMPVHGLTLQAAEHYLLICQPYSFNSTSFPSSTEFMQPFPEGHDGLFIFNASFRKGNKTKQLFARVFGNLMADVRSKN